MDGLQQDEELPPTAKQFLQSMALLTSTLPGSDKRQKRNILKAAVKEYLPEAWLAASKDAAITREVDACLTQLSKPKYSRIKSVQPYNAAVAQAGATTDTVIPPNCVEVYSPLLTASSLLSHEPLVFLQTTCTQCPVCGAQHQLVGSPTAGDDQQNMPTKPSLLRTNQASYPLVLTMTGPKQGHLKEYKCSGCKCVVAMHTATTPEGQHLMLDLPLEEVGVMAINKGLYIEGSVYQHSLSKSREKDMSAVICQLQYALLQQLLLTMHTFGSSYQRTSQYYNCMWSWHSNKPALSPDGSDLQRTIQLFALNHLDWRNAIWPWVEQQLQGPDKTIAKHVQVAKHHHPGVLFVYGHTQHRGPAGDIDDMTTAAATAPGTQQRQGTYLPGSQTLSSPVGPNTPSPLLQRRRKRALAYDSESPADTIDPSAGLLAASRIAVMYLESRHGGLQHLDGGCSNKLCKTSAKVVLVDGTVQNILLHCCAEPGCREPPVNRTGAARNASVMYCEKHVSCHTNQAGRTLTNDADAFTAMESNSVSSQQVADKMQMKGVLGVFAPCGQLLAFSLQYIPEQPSSILAMLSEYYKHQLPDVIVYNDTPKVLQYLKAHPEQEPAWSGRFVMDVMRWKNQWQAAMAAITNDRQPDTSLSTPQVLAECSPFEKDVLKHLMCIRCEAISHQPTLSEVQEVCPQMKEVPWYAICRPNAYCLKPEQASVLMPGACVGADEQEVAGSSKKYVYIQVQLSLDKLSGIQWDQLSAAEAANLKQCMADCHVKVFRLEISTELAESNWKSLGYHALSSVSKMTHDHGYIHMQLTAAAASAHKAACMQQQMAGPLQKMLLELQYVEAKNKFSITGSEVDQLKAERMKKQLKCSQPKKDYSVPAVLAPSCISLPVCLNVPQRWPRVRLRLPWQEPGRSHPGCNDVEGMDYEGSDSDVCVVEPGTDDEDLEDQIMPRQNQWPYHTGMGTCLHLNTHPLAIQQITYPPGHIITFFQGRLGIGMQAQPAHPHGIISHHTAHGSASQMHSPTTQTATPLMHVQSPALKAGGYGCWGVSGHTILWRTSVIAAFVIAT